MATIKKISLLLALFIIVVFAVFLFNQTVQIVKSARDVNMTLGNCVMWALIFIYCLLVVTPIVLWFNVPKRMSPPFAAGGAEYERFMKEFRKRLSKNPRLRGILLNTADDFDSAIHFARQAGRRGRRLRCFDGDAMTSSFVRTASTFSG